MAVRMALGLDVHPDYRALPRATYTDPEAASVGLTLDQAKAAGIDAVEYVADFATSSRGLRAGGEDRPHHDDVRPGDARAGRGGDGLPGRIGGDPRVRPGDPGPRPGRGAGRHDPRLPVDVADPQRAVRARRAQTDLRAGCSRLSARTPPRRRSSRAAAGPSRARRPARPGRSGPRREHDEVGPLARGQPAAVGLGGDRRPARRTPPGAPARA